MSSSMSRLLSISLVVLIGVARVLAQGGATGALSGTVLDPSGAVVAGAEVRIVNQDTGTLTRTVKTDSAGSFPAQVLPFAASTVPVAAAGAARGRSSNIGGCVAAHTRKPHPPPTPQAPPNTLVPTPVHAG